MAPNFDGTSFHESRLSGRAHGSPSRPGDEKWCPKEAGVQNQFKNLRFAVAKHLSPGMSCAKRKSVGDAKSNFQKTRWVPRVRGRGS